MRNFEAHTDDIRNLMLNEINVKSIDDLFAVIPDCAKIKDFNLENGISEHKAQKVLDKLSKQNNTDYICFMGGGAYKRFIPSAVKDTASRFEFLSAYTPYQAEISQGTLQIMYEFQTLICNLTNMDVSNASVYDAASACAEALLMSVRINKTKKVFVSDKINPNYLEVIKTYLWANDIELVIQDIMPDKEFSGALYQYPDYYGELNKLPLKKGKELIIGCCDLMALASIEPPVVDIMVGDIQTLGIPLNFGGPYGGYMACKDIYKRQLVGRIAGKSKDSKGKDAYVLTLQAREQHIRREKATGNICSNQALMALWVTLYASIMGKSGITQASNLSYKNAHILAEKLKDNGFKILSGSFFNEFVLEVEDACLFLDKLRENKILGGIKIDEKRILVCATEYNDIEDIDLYIKAI